MFSAATPTAPRQDDLWSSSASYSALDSLSASDKKSCTSSQMLQGQLVLLERSIFLASVFSIALFGAWITWMPLLHVLIPEFKNEGDSNIVTISSTFSEFNALVTIYLILPLSVFLLFRCFRIFRANYISDAQKKGIFLIVLIDQVFILIVMRYDEVRGVYHFSFTAAAILCLYLYHIFTWDYSDDYIRQSVKAGFGVLSVLGVCIFAFTQFFADIDNNSVHELSCVAEVCGICFLGLMDLVDIKTLGEEIDIKTMRDEVNSKTNQMWLNTPSVYYFKDASY